MNEGMNFGPTPGAQPGMPGMATPNAQGFNQARATGNPAGAPGAAAGANSGLWKHEKIDNALKKMEEAMKIFKNLDKKVVSGHSDDWVDDAGETGDLDFGEKRTLADILEVTPAKLEKISNEMLAICKRLDGILF